MSEHLTIEDMERYASGELNPEYLNWFAQANEHITSCIRCQNRLQKFLLIDSVTEDFRAKAFIGMGSYLEKQNKKSLLLRLQEKMGQLFNSENIQNILTVSLLQCADQERICCCDSGGGGDVSIKSDKKKPYVRVHEREDGYLVEVCHAHYDKDYAVELTIQDGEHASHMIEKVGVVEGRFGTFFAVSLEPDKGYFVSLIEIDKEK